MKIKEYFALYKKLKSNKSNSLKQFCFLDKKISLIKYLKNNKGFIIKNINYSFFSIFIECFLSGTLKLYTY